jgi:hypothetical protein
MTHVQVTAQVWFFCAVPRDDAVLLPNEFVLGGVMHSRSAVTVRLTIGSATLRIQVPVHTTSSLALVRELVDPTRPGDRSVVLVPALASNRGATEPADPAGKPVLVEVGGHSPPDEPGGKRPSPSDR